MERKLYQPRRPERIELSGDHVRRRWIAAALLLAVALAAFGLGVSRSLARSGWTEIEARTGCAAEFSLRYCLDEKGGTAQYRVLTGLYAEACQRAAQVYSSSETLEELGNLQRVNSHPNEIVTVEPELYAALALVQEYGNRVPYLAPIYENYGSLFFCTDDAETAGFDPLQDPTLAAYYREVAAFAGDPAQIDLELLGENRLRLRVSEEYLRYARENEIGTLFDLGWMKNAFIADDLAAVLRSRGFTQGCLQSRDGFGVNLYEGDEPFGLKLYARGDSGAVQTAEMAYTGPLSWVALRSFSLNPGPGDWYYEFADGEIRSIYVDPADGQPRTAAEELLLWSKVLGCGELLLRACPAFLAERLEPAGLDARDLSWAACEGKTLLCSDPQAVFPRIADGYTIRYLR